MWLSDNKLKVIYIFEEEYYAETLRACLHGGGAPQVGEVTCLGGVKNNPSLHAILQPRHPGVHFLKIIEWWLSS